MLGFYFYILLNRIRIGFDNLVSKPRDDRHTYLLAIVHWVHMQICKTTKRLAEFWGLDYPQKILNIQYKTGSRKLIVCLSHN